MSFEFCEWVKSIIHFSARQQVAIDWTWMHLLDEFSRILGIVPSKASHNNIRKPKWLLMKVSTSCPGFRHHKLNFSYCKVVGATPRPNNDAFCSYCTYALPFVLRSGLVGSLLFDIVRRRSSKSSNRISVVVYWTHFYLDAVFLCGMLYFII